MRKVGWEDPFCVLIYMNSYIFHSCFILFILLSYLIFDFVCLTLSSTDTHGIAKYARTYIQDTHTQVHTQKKKKEKVERLERLGKKKKEKVGKPQKKKRWGVRKERKKGETKKGRKEKGGMKEKNERKGGKGKKKGTKRGREMGLVG